MEVPLEYRCPKWDIPLYYFLQGEVAIYGVRNVKIYAREIIAARRSKIAFITPDWEQEFPPIGLESNGDGSNGANGNSGEAGPQGE